MSGYGTCTMDIKILPLKGRPPNEFSKDLTRKSGFSKIEQNADLEKTTKTPPSERAHFCRHFELPNTKIGLETMEIS